MIIAKNLEKSFKKHKEILKVLDGISLEIKAGEFLSFFGPNGCGKTTFLNIVAGLLAPDKGEIKIGGKLPKEAKVGFVFQNYSEALFPWRTALGNVEFGLEMAGVLKEKRREVAGKFLAKIGMHVHKDKYIAELSGGMKQKTAIARALVCQPDIWLFDEPFSSLDWQTTLDMMQEVQKLWWESRKTTLFVSHYIEEAIWLADRVVIFSKRPARISGIVEVNLSRPRTLEMLQSEEFFKLRNEVLKLFKI